MQSEQSNDFGGKKNCRKKNWEKNWEKNFLVGNFQKITKLFEKIFYQFFFSFEKGSYLTNKFKNPTESGKIGTF